MFIVSIIIITSFLKEKRYEAFKIPVPLKCIFCLWILQLLLWLLCAIPGALEDFIKGEKDKGMPYRFPAAIYDDKSH